MLCGKRETRQNIYNRERRGRKAPVRKIGYQTPSMLVRDLNMHTDKMFVGGIILLSFNFFVFIWVIVSLARGS